MFTQDDNQPKVTNVGSSASQDQDQDQDQDSFSQSAQTSQSDDISSYQPPVTQMKTDDNSQGEDMAQSQTPPSSSEDYDYQSQTSNQSDIDAKLAELEELVQNFQNKNQSEPAEDENWTANQDFTNDSSMLSSTPISPISSTFNPASAQASTLASSSANQNQTNSEDLADQNIFFLLGAEDGSLDEQEQFLDELQQVIWDDFVQNDMPLLITTEEKVRADEILAETTLDELQKQDQLLSYLEPLIPDLEEIMLEKAMKLKQDLVRERIESMKESYAQDQSKIAELQEAELLINQGKWLSAGKKLNQVS